MNDHTVTANDTVRSGILWFTVMPASFVILWSTGFISAKLGLPHAEPFTFLAVRFALAAGLLAGAALIVGAPWPTNRAGIRDAVVVGLLIHGVYLGGIFAAIHRGLPAGVAALIVGMQPLLTAVAAGPFLGERVSARQWVGLVVGLAGVALVLENKLALKEGDLMGIALTTASLVGITAGTLYQKRHGSGMDLRTGSAIQFAAAGFAISVPALLFESMEIQWTGAFIFALSWLVVVLSLGAISLLYLMIRHGAAAKVASLFYLVPPVTALFAYFLFGETLGSTAILGMGVAVVGVALVTRS